MFLIFAVSSALAQDYQSPNSLVGVGAGTPSIVSLRGEAWFAEEASFEVGLGLPSDFELSNMNADAALRWRPDIACIGCGGRILATFGLGVGSVFGPSDGFGGPWAFAVGPDLIGTGIYWLTPQLGAQLSLRGGFGPAWVGTNFDDVGTAGWFMGSAGLAF